MSAGGWTPLWERIAPEHLAAAIRDIESGIPKATAFVALGYSRSAFHRAQTAGREAEAKDDAGEPLTKREAGALAFWRKLETAFAKAEITILKSIAKAGQGEPRRFTMPDGTVVERNPRQWQAEKWRLECTRPEYRTNFVEPPQQVEPPKGVTNAEREADLRAFAASRGLRLVPDVGGADEYDPATATKGRT